MKRKGFAGLLLVTVLMFSMLSSAFAAQDGQGGAVKSGSLAMKIGRPWLLTPDESRWIDESNTLVTPITEDGRTLLPIAPVVYQMGGVVVWDAAESKVTIALNDIRIDLWVDRTTAVVNGTTRTLDVPPRAVKGRTMVPVRFVAENLGAKVLWDSKTQIVLIYYGGAAPKETDWSDYGGRIAELEAKWKTEDNRKAGEALDYWGIKIKVGDRVSYGIFLGTVREIRGSQVLVYWDESTIGDIPDDAVDVAWSLGVKWKEEQWMDASELFVEAWAK